MPTRLSAPALAVGIAAVAASSPATFAGSENSTVRVDTLYEHSQCGGEAGLEWIADDERLDALKTRLRQHRSGNEARAFKRFDALTANVFLLDMGLQPTPGYSISPIHTEATAHGDTVVVAINWRTPPAGMLLPQMVTTPCLVFSVSKGRYSRLKLLDQRGIEHGQVRPGEATRPRDTAASPEHATATNPAE